MLAMRGSSWPRHELMTAQPACPNCGRPMHLMRSTPRTGGLPPLETYRCGECGVSLIEAAGEERAG